MLILTLYKTGGAKQNTYLMHVFGCLNYSLASFPALEKLSWYLASCMGFLFTLQVLHGILLSSSLAFHAISNQCFFSRAVTFLCLLSY